MNNTKPKPFYFFVLEMVEMAGFRVLDRYPVSYHKTLQGAMKAAESYYRPDLEWKEFAESGMRFWRSTKEDNGTCMEVNMQLLED